MDNYFVTLKEYQPTGAPRPDIFEIKQTDKPTAVPEGHFLLRVDYISVDPYLSFKVRQPGGHGEFEGFTLGAPLEGFLAGVVEDATGCKGVKKGDVVAGMGRYQRFQVVKEGTGFLNVATGVSDDHLSYLIGVLGMPGCTAWAGVKYVLEAKEGQVLFVSGAAGAVGSLVGQLGRLKGLTVIGSAGSADKLERLKSFGFTHVFNYKECKSAADVERKLREFCPDGIDLYFDNVGGDHLQGAIAALREHGRIAICGQISQYGAGSPELVPNPSFPLLMKKARMEGFLVFDWLSQPEEMKKFYSEMGGWLKSGAVSVDETEFPVSRFGDAMAALFSGGNLGKAVVKME